ncbi:MAG: serine dehydratase, partial [Clostridia bacterium]|nr:serine dehydratase [Clostridia bacterium]
MKSLKQLYRIGKGPSSSHTIGPERACKLFLDEHPQADAFRVTLYGSLAKTGVGHGTGEVIASVLHPVEVLYDTQTEVPHPNTMDITAWVKGEPTGVMRVYSVGGGAISVESRTEKQEKDVYPLHTLTEIRTYCEEHGMRLYDYVYACEGEDIRGYLATVWKTMKGAVERGIERTG